jgi:hypothetical protein
LQKPPNLAYLFLELDREMLSGSIILRLEFQTKCKHLFSDK